MFVAVANGMSIMEKFNLDDIVVFEGAITKFGVIRYLVDWEDDDLDVDIRLADRDEIKRYHNRPEKTITKTGRSHDT